MTTSSDKVEHSSGLLTMSLSGGRTVMIMALCFMLGICAVLSFIGLIEISNFVIYQPIFHVNSLDVSVISCILSLVVEVNGPGTNTLIFVSAMIFNLAAIFWLSSGLAQFGSGGALNTGDRTYEAIFNGLIVFNEDYVRQCFVSPYNIDFFVSRFVFMSILDGMHAVIVFPRHLFLFCFSFTERVRLVDITLLFQSMVEIIVVKLILAFFLLADLLLIFFFVFADVPPLHVFMDSPNVFAIALFTLLLATDALETRNDLARLMLVIFLLPGSITTSVNVYDEYVFSDLSYLNETGYYYDLKDEKRVGGFCLYEGVTQLKDVDFEKFAFLQYAYHSLNIGFCVASAMTLGVVIFMRLFRMVRPMRRLWPVQHLPQRSPALMKLPYTPIESPIG